MFIKKVSHNGWELPRRRGIFLLFVTVRYMGCVVKFQINLRKDPVYLILTSIQVMENPVNRACRIYHFGKRKLLFNNFFGYYVLLCNYPK
jgi:hypothetical protein